MKLTFIGAVKTVTGSKTLVDIGGRKILVDCGLFQGLKELRLRNWSPLPVSPNDIDAVVLTHGQTDHSGESPVLIKKGFKGTVYATEATRDLCDILLPDSGFIQEREAESANKHGYSKHHPAFPLYTRSEAKASLKHFRIVPFDEAHDLGAGLKLTFKNAGHILGASQARLEHKGRSILFSGDLGRYDDPICVSPAPGGAADYLVVESTYGDRLHAADNPEEMLAEIIKRTAARGGTVLIPAFAVGRAQTITYHLNRLMKAGRIPHLPIFLDSPMMIDAGDLFRRHQSLHRLSEKETDQTCNIARHVRDVEESKELNSNHMPKVLISASGMATGGRVLHHIKHLAPNFNNTIVFTGFQAAGTRGNAMINGAAEVKIHGRQVPIRAEVANLEMLSAHADADGIMTWLKTFEHPPKKTFINHGESQAAIVLRRRIEKELGWSCLMPDYLDEVKLQ